MLSLATSFPHFHCISVISLASKTKSCGPGRCASMKGAVAGVQPAVLSARAAAIILLLGGPPVLFLASMYYIFVFQRCAVYIYI